MKDRADEPGHRHHDPPHGGGHAEVVGQDEDQGAYHGPRSFIFRPGATELLLGTEGLADEQGAVAGLAGDGLVPE